jgi:cob(I)alamin adenosyltransferase
MKIYTRTGDEGTTGLFGGERVRKDALRVEAYGTVDECNAAIGTARAHALDPALDALLHDIQNQLFVVGGDLATPGPSDYVPRTTQPMVDWCETQIDALEAGLPALRRFILPGGTPAAAGLHLARTVCRRAERLCVALHADEPLTTPVLQYLNRLSDLLFVLARAANARAGRSDVFWEKPTV